MSKHRVLLTDFAWPDVELERSILAEIGAELVVADRADADRLAELAADADAILTCWANVPSAVLHSASRCRIVARLGIGLDNIDVPAATERGIVVTNVPDYCTIEVAEHTLALILALARKVAFFHAETKQDRYSLSAAGPLSRTSGKTLGIVGLGQIGRAVAERARALGMNVVAARRKHDAPPGVRLCPLAELLSQSDYISLHLPLDDSTRHLISTERLAAMKPTACLINTARGGLVDHGALARALEQGRLAGAALDVQDPEPPELGSPPWNDPRVIVTPHAAFASDQSLLELRTRATRQVVDRLSGRIPPHVVNPQVLG